MSFPSVSDTVYSRFWWFICVRYIRTHLMPQGAYNLLWEKTRKGNWNIAQLSFIIKVSIWCSLIILEINLQRWVGVQQLEILGLPGREWQRNEDMMLWGIKCLVSLEHYVCVARNKRWEVWGWCGRKQRGLDFKVLINHNKKLGLPSCVGKTTGGILIRAEELQWEACFAWATWRMILRRRGRIRAQDIETSRKDFCQ